MSAIFERKDKLGRRIGWQARIRRRGFPELTKTFRTQEDAEAWHNKTLSEMQRGLWRDSTEAEHTSLGEALERYLKEETPQKRGARQEASRIQAMLLWPEMEQSMASIRGATVRAMLERLLKSGNAPATVARFRAILSHLFNVARKEWGMETLQNPVNATRPPRVANARERRLEDDEQARLLQACRQVNPELEQITRFALETAMRQGEILEMRWEHVSFSAHTVRIPRENAKNGESRTIPLTKTAEQILSAVPRRIDGRVWSYTGGGFRASWNKARHRAEILDLRFHDLRHEAISRLFEKTVLEIMEIRSITGHKTLQMLSRYTHLRPDRLVERLRSSSLD
ncbi:MAG: site-specific integrase [Acidithiobacillus sp.]